MAESTTVNVALADIVGVKPYSEESVKEEMKKDPYGEEHDYRMGLFNDEEDEDYKNV